MSTRQNYDGKWNIIIHVQIQMKKKTIKQSSISTNHDIVVKLVHVFNIEFMTPFESFDSVSRIE